MATNKCVTMGSLTDSIQLCIKEELEEGSISLKQLAENWNVDHTSLIQHASYHKWLTPINRKRFQEKLEANPKLTRKLSSHNNKAHKELSLAEKLVVKKAKAVIDYQMQVLDIGLEALDNLKNSEEGLVIRSAFDFQKVSEVMDKTLGLNDAKPDHSPTVNVQFSSAKFKPRAVVDIDVD